MSNRTLVLPSASYDAGHERQRNRRIEEVIRNTEVNFSDLLRSMFVPACLVSELPTATAGVRGFVTDANATTFASAVAGGGANGVPVYHDGTIWRIG